jgi:integrase
VLDVRRGKTKAARRTLGLTEESKLILGRRMAGSSQWLFPSPRVPLAHIGRLNYSHDEVCRETGLNFCLYDLRHTFATRMAQSGCDLATLAAILGHSSLRLVMRYVHPTAEHQRAAMERYSKTVETIQVVQ